MLSLLRAMMTRRAGSQVATLAVTGAMLTDVGAVRTNNEDSVLYVLGSPGRTGLAVVADGMGGHAAGEVASGIATATVVDRFLNLRGAIPRRFALAFAEANDAIRAHARLFPETATMGTTCTALAFAEDGVFLGHVGDSRAYLIRGDEVRQLSEDHSLVADMVRKNLMTEREAAQSADRNVILRAMGIDDHLEPQITLDGLAMQEGDAFVLCSDGLSDLVSTDVMRAHVMAMPPEAACRALIDVALAAGGHDNISVGVFRAEAAGAGAISGDEVLSTTRETSVEGGVKQ